MSSATPVSVWSPSWYRAAARLAAVGVATGALTGNVLVLLLTGPSLLTDPWDGAAFTIASLAGGLLAVPVVVLGATTGLVVAARAPRRRVLATSLLLLWPVALAGGIGAMTIVLSGLETGWTLLTIGVVLAVVVASVVVTQPWVTAPLRSPNALPATAKAGAGSDE
ncbi:hypothetical protein SAMN06264364_107141 [Quadrisphaera granulorum]|uniref:Uncharacterized protein n=1 Tax=Quadrisphaera granulorum TaxID=317664 RepID=A0A316A9K8_9ACTN|nr:hypothetical protein [Quadrisphaera granulorum]PWJ54445.1 hypothetical protein BXY45_107141 [Quadrisphaera granulorum]SZE96217.1 hypothetical protein SAMN06264364_107141 [Quadrisphaera granulorum]